MSDSVQVKTACHYCKQAVSNKRFLEAVESDSPTSFYDWKVTIIFYCGLHYIKSFAKTKGIQLSDHKDFNIKTTSQGTGLSPILVIDGNIRRDFINLRTLSYHSRYDGYFSDKVNTILRKGRYSDSKKYLSNIENWIVPKLEAQLIETNYSF